MTSLSASAPTKRRMTVADLTERLYESESMLEVLTERLAEMELARDDAGWIRIGDTRVEMDRNAIIDAAYTARMMYLRNPLIWRAAHIQASYVWGQGIEVQAKDEDVNAVVQSFIDHPRNQAELFSHAARLQREVELKLDGNLFLALITDASTGDVHVRSFPLFEVETIITNPQDNREVWYYRRTWDEKEWDYASGQATVTRKTAYYPDWRYEPANKPGTQGGHKVHWETKIYHVRTGGFSDWRFGLSEMYSVLDWARAYKDFLEDWSTLVKAYSRFAWKMTTKGGKAGVAAARAKMGRSAATDGATAPPPLVGSTFVGGEGVDFQPIKTSGATISADDGRRLLLMMAAGTGFPETFFGDVSVGTLATAESLDRPTELAMKNRQTMWAGIYKDIVGFAIEASAKTAGGALTSGSKVTRTGVLVKVELGGGKEADLDIDFPPVVEQGTTAKIDAIIKAATLDGKTLAAIPDMRVVARMLLTALGADDIDTILEGLFPKDVETNVLKKPEPAPPAEPSDGGDDEQPEPDDDAEDPDEEPTSNERSARNTRSEEAYRKFTQVAEAFLEKYGAVDAR